MHHQVSVRVRGLYGTALTALLLTQGHRIVDASAVIQERFGLPHRQAPEDRQLAAGSPVLAVLGTDADTPAAWLTAGQALMRVLLQACRQGMSASFLNQPIEVAELRPRLREVIGCPGFPQLLLRMGYGHAVRPTPRRPLGEVIV